MVYSLAASATDPAGMPALKIACHSAVALCLMRAAWIVFTNCTDPQADRALCTTAMPLFMVLCSILTFLKHLPVLAVQPHIGSCVGQ